jgi:L-rhamnose isomerase
MNIWIPDGMKDITVDRLARVSVCWPRWMRRSAKNSTRRITSTP